MIYKLIPLLTVVMLASTSSSSSCNESDDDDTWESLDNDNDGWSIYDGDCDDNNAAIYPTAEEVVDRIDNDCDGEIDENLVDNDGDHYSEWDGDCNDDNPQAYPGAPEFCNSVDENCDGFRDYTVYYTDSDEDGFGALPSFVIECSEIIPEGLSLNWYDCDDTNFDVNPDVIEIPYDGVDNDCSDGDLIDVDGDDYEAVEVGGDDCVDDPKNEFFSEYDELSSYYMYVPSMAKNIHPMATEYWDEIDNDCDGSPDSVIFEIQKINESNSFVKVFNGDMRIAWWEETNDVGASHQMVGFYDYINYQNEEKAKSLGPYYLDYEGSYTLYR
jgi:hypothetical protein